MDIGLTVSRARGSERIEELYDAHMTSAVRFAYLLCGDRELAQDLAHDAFIRVSSRLGALRSPEKFAPYLRSTILNGYRSHYRSLKRERAFLDSQRRDDQPIAEPPDIETRDRMQKALDELSPRRKAAVVLRYYEDMSERQTAEILGCSVGAVKALVARGLKHLRVDLEGENDDTTDR